MKPCSYSFICMGLLCLAKAGLQRRAVPAVSCDQGLHLIQGSGPEARGNFTVCPQAEMWDLAQGSLDRGQRELLSTAGAAGGSCSGLAPHRLRAADRAPVQGGVRSQHRRTRRSVPQILEENIKKTCTEQSKQNRQKKALATTAFRALRLFFLFL